MQKLPACQAVVILPDSDFLFSIMQSYPIPMLHSIAHKQEKALT